MPDSDRIASPTRMVTQATARPSAGGGGNATSNSTDSPGDRAGIEASSGASSGGRARYGSSVAPQPPSRVAPRPGRVAGVRQPQSEARGAGRGHGPVGRAGPLHGGREDTGRAAGARSDPRGRRAPARRTRPPGRRSGPPRSSPGPQSRRGDPLPPPATWTRPRPARRASGCPRRGSLGSPVVVAGAMT